MTGAKALTGLAVGVGAFFSSISNKNAAITSRDIRYQFADAVSAIAGPQAGVAVGKVLFSNPNFGKGDLLVGSRQFNPLGALNQTVGMGILVLIVDAVLSYFKLPYYSKVRGFVTAAGGGLIAGGVLGGIFDPPPDEEQRMAGHILPPSPASTSSPNPYSIGLAR